MSDAATALALMIVPAASPAAGTAAASAKSASAAAQGDANGFAAFVLAATAVNDAKAALAAAGEDAAALPQVVTDANGAPLVPKDGKTKASGSDYKTVDDSTTDTIPTIDTALALAMQPLAPTTPVTPPAPMSDEAKSALVAAAEDVGDAIPSTPPAPTATLPTPAAAPVDTAGAPADAQTADATTTVPQSADGTTTDTAQQGEAAAKPTPPPTPVDAETAANTLAAVSVPDLVPPAPVLSDPAAVLGEARKATEATAAAGQALGTQAQVLGAARDLLAPDPAKADIAPPPPLDKPRPSEQAAAQAFEPPHPKTAVNPPSSSEAPAQKSEMQQPAPAPDRAPETAESTTNLNQAAARDDRAAPVNTNTSATPPASHALPQADARPLPMTVVRADTSAGALTLPADQIAVSIARQFRQGTNRFEIRLDPPELGRIDVRLDLGHSGQASATLTVDRPETLHLLTRDARALQQMLSDAGLRTDSGSLNFTLRDQSGQQAGSDQNRGGSMPKLPNEALIKPENKAPILLTASLEPGRLDMRV